MSDGRNIAEELSEQEKKSLTEAYGSQIILGSKVNAKERLESVHDLTEREIDFFGQEVSDSTGLSVQMLYKHHGTIVPVRFVRIINLLVERDPMLRSGYFLAEERILRVTFSGLKSEIDVVFRNLAGNPADEIEEALSNYMEADMRHPFDLERGPLFRFAVFNTGKDEYAILLTVLGHLRNHFDIGRMLAGMGAEGAEDVRTPFAGDTAAEEKPLAESKGQVGGDARRYWGQLLAGMPAMPALPGYRETGRISARKAYRLPGLEAYQDLLAKKSGGNKEKFICILQTAWCLFLQHVNKTSDVCCCVQMVVESGTVAGPVVIPFRLRAKDGYTVGATVEKQLGQLQASGSYGSVGRKGMAGLLGSQHGFFNHILNFGEFGGYAQAFSGGAVVENAWDMRGLPLAVCFRFRPSGIAASFLYDEGAFLPGGVERLAWEYEMTLHHVLTLWGSTLSDFHGKLAAAFSGQESALSTKEDSVEKMLSEFPLFVGISMAGLQRLSAHASLSVRYEGDYIISFPAKPTVYFLAEGQLARLMDSGSGWLNMLDIVTDGAWVNETVLLPKCKSKSAAEVLSEEARLIAIPLEDFEAVLDTEPMLLRRLMLHTLKEMEKYQRYWTEI